MFAALVSAVRSAQLRRSFVQASRHFIDPKATKNGQHPDYWEEDVDGEPTEIAKSIALGGKLIWGPTMTAAVSLESAQRIGRVCGNGKIVAVTHYST